MNRQYWPLSVSCPASTTAAAPLTTSWPVVWGHLHSVRARIPAGHNGRTGVRVLYDGVVVMPWSLTGWLVGSGETFDIAWEDGIADNKMEVQTYNTDSVAHTFYLYADILPSLGQSAVGVPQVISRRLIPGGPRRAIAGIGQSAALVA